MEVNKLESREVLTMLFGLPIMVTMIVLASIAVGHVVTARSDRPTNVTVSAATPNIEVNVPNAPAPNIHVAAASPKIDVNVPQGLPPTINVATPPAVVTVLEKQDSKPPLVPAPTPVPAAEKKILPAPAAVPASSPEPNKTSALPDKDSDINTLYQYAEKYIESYCKKNGLDSAKETAEWTKKWKQGLDQAMADNIDSSEQTYINRVVINKRDCFDLTASPEKMVEGCRLMLRYRDGQMAWLKAMKDAATAENMQKTIAVLAAGVR